VEPTKEAARGGVAGDKVQAPEVDHEEDGVGPQHGEEVRALHPAEGGAPQLRHRHVQHQAHLHHRTSQSDTGIKEDVRPSKRKRTRHRPLSLPSRHPKYQ
jgi:hypothetical protein